MDKRIKSLSVVTFALVLCSSAWGQTCAKQPPTSIKDIYEWGCKDMDYSQAWNTLTAAGIAPVRPAKITELGTKTNRRSRKQLFIVGLRIAQIFTPAIPLVGDINEWWAQALMVAGPKLLEEGVEFVAGEPDEFIQTPSDAGFVTIYSGPTSQQIVGQPPESTSSSSPAADKTNQRAEEVKLTRFQPTSWYTLYTETQALTLDQRDHMRRYELAWRALDRETTPSDVPVLPAEGR